MQHNTVHTYVLKLKISRIDSLCNVCTHSRSTESVDNPVPVVHDAWVCNEYHDVEDCSGEQRDDDL